LNISVQLESRSDRRPGREHDIDDVVPDLVIDKQKGFVMR
jgi:hypothetical protein